MAAAETENVTTTATTTTRIGPSIVIRGKLTSAEDLVVLGRIEAEVTSTRALIVEDPGVILANVRVNSARVSGVVIGNVAAEEKVELTTAGRLVGDISAPRLVIREGAAFRGRIGVEARDGERPQADRARAPSIDATTGTARGEAQVAAPPAAAPVDVTESPTMVADSAPAAVAAPVGVTEPPELVADSVPAPAAAPVDVTESAAPAQVGPPDGSGLPAGEEAKPAVPDGDGAAASVAGASAGADGADETDGVDAAANDAAEADRADGGGTLTATDPGAPTPGPDSKPARRRRKRR